MRIYFLKKLILINAAASFCTAIGLFYKTEKVSNCTYFKNEEEKGHNKHTKYSQRYHKKKGAKNSSRGAFCQGILYIQIMFFPNFHLAHSSNSRANNEF